MVDTYQTDPRYQSLIMGVGDLSNYGAVEADWDQYFFNPVYEHTRERLAHVPFHTAIGNHDFYETAHTWDIEGTIFKKYFPYPFVDDRFWSFDYGPAHFVIADLYPEYFDPGIPETVNPGVISPEQALWLEQDLAATDKRWKFVFLHEPGWSAGPHPNNPAVQDTLHPLCVAHDVAIVFAGHHHYYARALVDGVQYITTGGGGASQYPPQAGWPYIITQANGYHFCMVEIAGAVLNLRAVTWAGDVLEQFTIDRTIAVGAATPPAPAVRLHQNHPNPFNPATMIPFELPVSANVTLRIFDVHGRPVRTLVDGRLAAATYRVPWDGRDHAGRPVPSGVFWYRLATSADGASPRTMTKSLVVLR
jgi:hypothetical protein